MALPAERSRARTTAQSHGLSAMTLARQIRSVSYLSDHAEEMLRTINEGGPPYIITQNDEATAVLEDLTSYERTQETLALLKLIAMGREDIAAGRVHPLEDVIAELKARTDLPG
jgi:prevent-host-death family protein